MSGGRVKTVGETERKIIRGVQAMAAVMAVVILCVLFFSAVPGSRQEMPWELPVIRFLGNERLAPILYRDRGETRGVAADIARAIGHSTGYRTEVVAMDWEEAQEMVLEGEADALLQINPTPEREERFDFSEELLKSEFSIFVRSRNQEIRHPNDLAYRRVGVERGGYPLLQLKKYDGITIERIPDWRTGFLLLLSGELDALVVDRWIGEYELAESGIRDIVVLPEPVNVQYSRIAVRKGNKELLDVLNHGLREIREDGTRDKILARWQGKNVVYFTEDRVRNAVAHSVIAAFGLILAVTLFFVHRLRRGNRRLEEEVRLRTRELHEANEKLQAANMELERISLEDQLTGIPNRRAFDATLQRSWDTCSRRQVPLALIMMDIDNFKAYNDTFGHPAGDCCLQQVAGVIRGQVKRPEDLAARYGGEEFAVILPETPGEAAARIAESIRRGVEKLEISQADGKSVVTISLGVVAVVPGPGLFPEDLTGAADRAMYQAKRKGRNRVVFQNLSPGCGGEVDGV